MPASRIKTVAIVGARHSTKYGEEIAYRSAYELAKHGVVIVSGMAYGIDACAHRGCLDAGGTTIAVLGTPIDRLYPACNRGLAERILEKGAIISEYPPGSITDAKCFQIRNRIVAGLADALLIVEASEHSGTCGTYAVANKQGKDIFVVPGDITREMSRGTNQMLREGAFPYIDPSDITVRLFGKTIKIAGRDLSSLSKDEARAYAAIANGFQGDDEIVDILEMSLPDFTTTVMALEMKGFIERRGVKWYAK